MKVKQVIVLRNDLKMRKGKAAAQAAHASLTAFRKLQDSYYSRLRGYTRDPLGMDKDGLPGNADALTREMKQVLDLWLTDGQAKICLKANSEEELVSIYDKFKTTILPSCIILDEGRTEFKAPTLTAIAIGPWWNNAIDPITGVLELI